MSEPGGDLLVLHADTPSGRAAVAAGLQRRRRVWGVRASVGSEPLGPNVEPLSVDATSEEDVRRLSRRLAGEGVRVDTLITCPAGVPRAEADGDGPTAADVVLRNLLAPMVFCRVFGDAMLEEGRGRIIQLVSNVAIDPRRREDLPEAKSTDTGNALAALAAAMGGLVSLSRHLAAQYRDGGVLINTLVHGPLTADEAPLDAEAYVRRVPLGRLMTLQDLTGGLELLLDPASTYITGQTIVMDGGVAIW